jgi:hypothetical protein
LATRALVLVRVTARTRLWFALAGLALVRAATLEALAVEAAVSTTTDITYWAGPIFYVTSKNIELYCQKKHSNNFTLRIHTYTI